MRLYLEENYHNYLRSLSPNGAKIEIKFLINSLTNEQLKETYKAVTQSEEFYGQDI